MCEIIEYFVLEDLEKVSGKFGKGQKKVQKTKLNKN